uniref:TspO/MBR family protein n=1 Tax=Megaviridae environmental sample TaxID=1737588 RepID=A0A5J6VJP2_9VIRU|nr:MAG: hypothetical protein [Megaviridae environmental sample]
MWEKIAFILMIIANYSIGGRVGAKSDQNKTLITPDGITFSIWGIIYVIVGTYVFTNTKTSTLGFYSKIFILSCILNIMWLLTWINGHVKVSSFVLFLLCGCVGILANNNEYKRYFGAYFGWTMLAATLNMLIAVGGSPVKYLWMLLVFVIGLSCIQPQHFSFYLALIWGLAGIARRYLNEKEN